MGYGDWRDGASILPLGLDLDGTYVAVLGEDTTPWERRTHGWIALETCAPMDRIADVRVLEASLVDAGRVARPRRDPRGILRRASRASDLADRQYDRQR